jgi:glucose/arabinose dehydrogenase
MNAFVQDLHFPTSLAVAPDGTLYVAESGLAFDGAPRGGRVSRIDAGGKPQPLLEGLREPVNGLRWHQNSLILSEGGHPGRISRYDLARGERSTLLDNLPSFGNYHTNMAVPGPDGKLYFSQGAMTNSGIIGSDSNDLAWLRAVQHSADIPGYDVELSSHAVTVHSPEGQAISTGAFAPFGSAHPGGTRLKGRTPCTAAIMRCNLDGSGLELVAWGLRNAFGLGFLPDGRLLATDQGADARGVRPVWHCPDFLYEVRAGAWYGWPDFFGGVPINDRRFSGPEGTQQPFLIQNHAELPPPERPLLTFEINSCASRFVPIPTTLRHAGDLIVAQFGDERPITGPPGPRVGRNLVRVDIRDWSVHRLPALPLQRPLDLAFSPDGEFLYVVDFGEFEFTTAKSLRARAGSGCIWKIPARFMEQDTMATVSFEKDIAPLFRQFRASMTWRLDLTKYEDVKLNASMVYNQISGQGMPPPPYPPLTPEQIKMFKIWIDEGFPK